MADFAFGEVTRLLYDAIWNEFCDWGVELAKVRLADASLPEATREATWWALRPGAGHLSAPPPPGDALRDGAAVGAIPHRASDPGLLIVARWPAPTGRDERVEAEVDAVLELVRGLRNARAEARVEATAWLPTEVVVPMSMGPTFEALRPAVERLARARPLERRLSREALGQGSGLRDAAR